MRKIKSLKRDYSLDAIKAFAIYLVVLGHIIQATVINFDENYIFKLIYSFHMPLFIFISGYVSYHEGGVYSGFLKRRFISLMVPFFVWLTFSTLLNYSMRNEDILSSLQKGILYPDNGLWYLWVLFFMHSLLYLCNQIFKKHTIILLLILYLFLLIFIYYFKVKNIFGIKTLSFLLFYFILGLFTSKYNALNFEIFKKWGYFIVLSLIFAVFWQRTNGIIFFGINLNSQVFTFIYKTIAGIVGIICCVGFFKSIHKFNKVILFVGTNSISIYAMNIYFIVLLRSIYFSVYIENLYLMFIVLFSVIVILMCLLVGGILKSNKYLSLLFLGLYQNNKVV
jgi:hypothetical protein